MLRCITIHISTLYALEDIIYLSLPVLSRSIETMQRILLFTVSLIVLLASSALAFPIQSATQHNSRHTLLFAAAPTQNNNDSINNPLHSRRNILVWASNLAFLSSCAPSANAAVLRSAGCANGEGEACADLADGNEFIQNLQKKSAENKEANQRVSLISLFVVQTPDNITIFWTSRLHYSYDNSHFLNQTTMHKMHTTIIYRKLSMPTT